LNIFKDGEELPLRISRDLRKKRMFLKFTFYFLISIIKNYSIEYD